jgi:SAM-dependent methyltransferase
MPFPDASFDKALCVHVLYFWKDLRTSFREIARVLKPGAKLALVFRSTDHAAAVQSFPADVYRFPDIAELTETLAQTGFTVIATPDTSNLRPHLLIATRIADLA